MRKILILEDNLAALKHLTGIIRELDMKNEVYCFGNLKDAYQCAIERTIDLFLIDIILDTSHPGDVSGLKFAENIREMESYRFVPIIFITSLEDSKLYTYEKLHCYSFIEKPFDEETVKQSVEQCLKFPESSKGSKTLFFRKEGIILAVEREDITYAESSEHIMHIYTRQGDVLKIPYITLKKLLEEVDSPDFIQCSRNTIINRSYIQNVDIPNRMIRLKGSSGMVEIGVMFKKHMKECFQ
ncbi:MAG: response regulator transcription factor [Lachnospiraceae bacterium]|nr:response regulator transcription factor [Lachnospiraceae bacterium]